MSNPAGSFWDRFGRGTDRCDPCHVNNSCTDIVNHRQETFLNAGGQMSLPGFGTVLTDTTGAIKPLQVANSNIVKENVKVYTGASFSTIEEHMKDLIFRMGIPECEIENHSDLKLITIRCSRLTALDSECLYTLLEDDVVKLQRIFTERMDRAVDSAMTILCSYEPEHFKKVIEEEIVL